MFVRDHRCLAGSAQADFIIRNVPNFFSLKPNFVWIKLELRSEDLL